MLNGDEDVAKCAEDKIDYTEVLPRVDKRRKESMDFLVNALNA